MKKVLCLIIFSLFLSSCASYTGVVPMGLDTFMIAKQQATGFPGLGNMKAELLVEASKYCLEQGKQMQVVSTEETKPPYILGNYPRTEIHFMCLRAGDKDLQRPKMQPAPDKVIELRSQ